MGSTKNTKSLDFLDAPGVVPQAIRSHDWSASALGEPCDWPETLKEAARQMLNSAHPMSICWGETHAYLFNDAHCLSAGDATLLDFLGSPAHQAFGQHWELMEPDVKRTMRGLGASWNRDRVFPRVRNGVAQDSFWTHSFSPIFDATEEHGVGGIMLSSIETTERVQAERRLLGKIERQERNFLAAPGFIAILRGPQHIYEFVNPAYLRLMGEREFIGRSVEEAVPEVLDQEFPQILNRVFTTGKRFASPSMPIMIRRGSSPAVERRLINFVFEPIWDKNGVVCGIFVEGFDVTEFEHSDQPETRRVKPRYASHPQWRPLF